MSSTSSKDQATGKKKHPPKPVEGCRRNSIAVRLIRHAESMNNQVYREAHKLYQLGTPDFDSNGWNEYVNTHRVADPGLSDRGYLQAEKLASYLVPNLRNQASNPVRFIVSPMKRALETALPTLEQLSNMDNDENNKNGTAKPSRTKVIVNGFYTESEGCYTRGKTESGFNQIEVSNILPKGCGPLSFEGYSDNPNEGWYENKSGPEMRYESEARAAKFYLWLCEYLDKELISFNESDQDQEDVFDAGVTVEGEEQENEYDKLGPRSRRRRTVVLVGHGDFMSLVMKRIVAGFGYAVEAENIPHRSAFVHFNTGITELEYFGSGRFLTMSTNHVPHLSHPDDLALKSGGGLKDGWSYLMPHDHTLSRTEIINFIDDEMDDHIKEQTEAMKSLYIRPRSFLAPNGIVTTSGGGNIPLRVSLVQKDENHFKDGSDPKSYVVIRRRSSIMEGTDSETNGTSVEERSNNVAHNVAGSSHSSTSCNSDKVTFVVKRGLQVVGCASFHEEENALKDVVIRPSEASDNFVGEALIHALRDHVKSSGRRNSNDSEHVVVESACQQSQAIFEKLGFTQTP